MQKFEVRQGAIGEVAKVSDRNQWQSWTTTKPVSFDEPVSRTRTMVVFRSGPWLLRVKVIDVKMYNGYRWVAMK
jgi:hypothetical protein